MKKIFVFLCVSLFAEGLASVEDSAVFDAYQINNKSTPRPDSPTSPCLASTELKRVHVDFSDDSGKFDPEIEELAKKLKDLPDIRVRQKKKFGPDCYTLVCACMDKLFCCLYGNVSSDQVSAMYEAKSGSVNSYCTQQLKIFDGLNWLRACSLEFGGAKELTYQKCLLQDIDQLINSFQKPQCYTEMENWDDSEDLEKFCEDAVKTLTCCKEDMLGKLGNEVPEGYSFPDETIFYEKLPQ